MNNTRKTAKQKKDGWISIHVAGTPFEIGLSHGTQLRKELAEVPAVLKHIVRTKIKMSYTKYMTDCRRLLLPILDRTEWAYIKMELHGIVAGAANPEITYELLVGWNAYVSMCTYYELNHVSERCSAFIATGSHVKDGGILMAHNTHTDFFSGFITNIAIYVHPTIGIPFRMQAAPGYICSVSDWFLCENGIIGCETTISNLNYRVNFTTPGHTTPYFLRIRQAMQFGKTLDDYVDIMRHDSAGDYACTWLLGDTKTGEIMLFDNGKAHHGVKRTYDGIFHASNEAGTQEMMRHEIGKDNHGDSTKSTGARYKRMDTLLFEVYGKDDNGKGQLDVATAKTIMADHNSDESNKNKTQGSQLTICKHLTNKLAGATDSKITNTVLAKSMKFWGRMGSPCGQAFKKNKTMKSLPIKSMPRHEWVIL